MPVFASPVRGPPIFLHTARRLPPYYHPRAAELSNRMRHIREQIQRGDQSGFAAIVREHQGLVFSVAYRFFGDRCVAEDVAQEVFLELYRSIDSIDSDQHLRMWLRRVTSHRCIDEARRRRVRPQLSIEEMPDLPS